ncbi:MAG: O-antigen ligase family protein [Verrucomicrobia bacterium]|nr:O-antigen ligase family protein [Verrucomicrobiota bacterium]
MGERAGDFRLKIYRDALSLSRDAGWTGAGLGNFSPLFPRYRTASMTASRAIHPESDWFWVLAEMGWPAVLLLAALVGLVLWRCLPFAEGTDRVLRSAAFAAVVVFLMHSLVDVSGHRIGTLWPALFLLALATPGGLGVRTEATLRSRVLGTGFLLLGLAWLISAFGFVKIPTSAEYLRLKRQMSAALDAKNYPEGAALATEALRLAPLDWELHFGRGAALAASVRVTSPAISNFTVVRWLEPVGRVGYEEGRAWLIREGSTKESDFWFGPEARLAADAWRAALATDPRSASGLFGSMLSTAREHPDILPYLKELAIGDRRREFEFLGSTSGEDFAEVLTSLLRGDPGLKGFKPEEQRLIFRLWAQRGDVRELGRAMEANPAWLALSWDSVGEVLARQGDFKTACELARRYYPKPEMPPALARSVASLREDYVSNRKDLGAGIYYFLALRASGEHKEALEVIRYLNSQPDAPGYFFALEGEVWFELKNYESAWRAWQVAAGR